MYLLFDVQYLYYIPQYMPVLQQLQSRGHDVSMVFYQEQDERNLAVCIDFIKKHSISAVWLKNKKDAFDFYQNSNADWIIFGNTFSGAESLNKKTALMQHGIGPKPCYYDVSNNKMTIRFVEGEHRLKRLQSLYPEAHFVDSGYAKLDPLINKTIEKLCLKDLGLDPSKKTILYAPTFYPSSIECINDDFPAKFNEFNIIIKPHFFSLFKKRYKRQRVKLSQWEKYANVYVTDVYDFDLTPFLDIADIMVSDASSAIFEFAALEKPVIWCDFYKLRWSYRGFFSFRIKGRVDEDIKYFNELCYRAENYESLKVLLKSDLGIPFDVKEIRKKVIYKLAGKVDGFVAERIVACLEEYK